VKKNLTKHNGVKRIIQNYRSKGTYSHIFNLTQFCKRLDNVTLGRSKANNDWQ